MNIDFAELHKLSLEMAVRLYLTDDEPDKPEKVAFMEGFNTGAFIRGFGEATKIPTKFMQWKDGNTRLIPATTRYRVTKEKREYEFKELITYFMTTIYNQ